MTTDNELTMEARAMSMKEAPDIYQIDNLLRGIESNHCQKEVAPGMWVPARPGRIGGLSQRLRAAWLVFTGCADALQWRGQ